MFLGKLVNTPGLHFLICKMDSDSTSSVGSVRVLTYCELSANVIIIIKRDECIVLYSSLMGAISRVIQLSLLETRIFWEVLPFSFHLPLPGMRTQSEVQNCMALIFLEQDF